MSSDDIAIRVENLSKCYTLYDAPRDRLKQFILPRLQRIVGGPPKNYYQEFWALKNVSFDVKRGETVGIVGRNGSGKSTLLQLMCGTLAPTGGEVETNGRVTALLELGAGFNPQFTGRENIYMSGAILGLPKEEIDARFDDIAAFAEIGDFIEQPVKTYSSGMYVRLAFAVQASIEPDILVVDEALAVGDERFQRKCFARLEKLKSQGASVLFVSHSAQQVVELCDKAMLLERGERVTFGHPMRVTRAYQRLIYAPDAEQEGILNEIRQQEDAMANDSESTLISSSPAAAEDSKSESLDLNLVSTTKTIYPVDGARIDSISIRDKNGRPVNLLEFGRDYQIVVAGAILSNLSQAHFGVHIRTVSGIVVTGQRHPEIGAFLDALRAGRSFEILYGFRMTLDPGAYFVGAGVWADAGSKCTHRVLDAVMFRVLRPTSISSFGYSDISNCEPRLSLF